MPRRPLFFFSNLAGIGLARFREVREVREIGERVGMNVQASLKCPPFLKYGACGWRFFSRMACIDALAASRNQNLAKLAVREVGEVGEVREVGGVYTERPSKNPEYREVLKRPLQMQDK